MILILGGARSGKSRFAAGLAKRQCKKVAYIATAPVCDEEMRQRVKLHKSDRPKNWITIEAQKDLLAALKKISVSASDGMIIECIGTYVSNLMLDGVSDSKIMQNIKGVLRVLQKMDKAIFIVSNEVGGGVVPDSVLGRRFRDIVGSVNQEIAKMSEEVYLAVAGLPMKLK